jgi:hypothetical protein
VQNDFLSNIQTFGLRGEAFIETARLSLVSAVHLGLLATMIVALIASAWVFRVPVIRFSRSAGQAKRPAAQAVDRG